jgi:hypothetical protein
MAWEHVGHVDPPPIAEETTTVGPGADQATFARSLIFYLGPNHYPAGLYLPLGYDLESRPGDDEGWKVLRARDSQTKQILTMWAVNESPDEAGRDERVKILDG